jgi:hypothetical protein
MSNMLSYAIVAFGVAALALLGAWRRRRKWRRMARAKTLTSAQLRQAFGAGGRRRSTKVCEVVGAAQPGPDGPLAARFSRADCVWHRDEIQRRDQHGRDEHGRPNVSSKPAGGYLSRSPFTVIDGTGSILVDPDRADIDQPERVGRGFIPHDGGPEGLAKWVMSFLRAGHETLGWDYQEWAIRPGTRLYVLGRASMAGGHLVMGQPARGRMIISTRSEADLTTGARRMYRFYLVLAVLALATGTALLVANTLGVGQP